MMEIDLNLLITKTNDFLENIIYFENSNNHFTKDSKADREFTTFERPESIITAYSQGEMFIEAAADQFFGITKLIVEPITPIAIWSCFRALLEASAFALWLLDSEIDSMTRVQRSIALRFEGIEQNIKFSRSIQNMEDSTTNLLERINEIEILANQLGLPCFKDKKEKVKAIGQFMPSNTDLIKSMLKEETNYRLASAVIHGHHWAIRAISYRKLSENSTFNNHQVKTVMFEKYVNIKTIYSVITSSVIAISKPILAKAKLFGWNIEKINKILAQVYKDLHITAE